MDIARHDSKKREKERAREREYKKKGECGKDKRVINQTRKGCDQADFRFARAQADLLSFK